MSYFILNWPKKVKTYWVKIDWRENISVVLATEIAFSSGEFS